MQPLDGVTVADFTRQLPGPFASRELLRLGARVVKIEPPDGDQRHPNAWYRALNDGKEIARRGTRAPNRRLRSSRPADVVLEGFRPGVFERLGVELAPTTILCSITGYGVDGTRALHAGHDLNYLGYAGVLADTAPALPPVQIADLAAGAQAAVIEVLAALLERARTGAGARIVVSMTHDAHRFVAHRARRRPAPAPAHRRRRVLPHLRDRPTAGISRSPRSSRSSGGTSASCSSGPTCSTARSTQSCPSSRSCSARGRSPTWLDLLEGQRHVRRARAHAH